MRSAAPSQKSRRLNHSSVWTEALTGMVFAVTQKCEHSLKLPEDFLNMTLVNMVTVSSFWNTNRELKQGRRLRQRERQKGRRFRLAKQQLCTCITLFSTFLCRHCATTTWKWLISSLMEDVNTTTFFFFLRIQLQKKLPAFDQLNEME